MRFQALLSMTASLQRFSMRFSDITIVLLSVILPGGSYMRKQIVVSTNMAASTQRCSAEPGMVDQWWERSAAGRTQTILVTGPLSSS